MMMLSFNRILMMLISVWLWHSITMISKVLDCRKWSSTCLVYVFQERCEFIYYVIEALAYLLHLNCFPVILRQWLWCALWHLNASHMVQSPMRPLISLQCHDSINVGGFNGEAHWQVFFILCAEPALPGVPASGKPPTFMFNSWGSLCCLWGKVSWA